MISVIMPVYNGEKFLEEAIKSILAQTETEFELIIINDGSTDNSEDIILTYSRIDHRIKYYKQENKGEGAARNLGLQYAKGEFICFQDADDISLPSRLEVLKHHFISPNIGFVHSDMLLINEIGKPIGYWQSRNILKERLLRFFLKIGTPFNNPSMMIRREAIRDLKYDTSFKIGTDTDMVSRFSIKWDSVHVPEPLLLYRRHSNNISNQKDYDTLFAHVQKFLNSYTLEELIPELSWNNGNLTSNKAKACAIISLFLFRRGMIQDGYAWYEKATNMINENDVETQFFVAGIGKLAIGEYEGALRLLQSCKTRDHILENYIGEAYALTGNITEAYNHFVRALELSPGYEEPIDNLKGLGGAIGLHLVDTSWMKFRKGM